MNSNEFEERKAKQRAGIREVSEMVELSRIGVAKARHKADQAAAHLESAEEEYVNARDSHERGAESLEQARAAFVETYGEEP